MVFQNQDEIVTHTDWSKSVRFVATPECNLHCSYCHREGREKNKELLSTKKTFELLSILSNSGVENIFIGGGEPFLREDIFEIMDFACDNFKRVKITSNGTCFPDNIPSRSSCFENIELSISLNTLRNTYYKIITGVDLLDKVVSKVKSIRGQFKLVSINFMLFKRHEIVGDFQDILRFCINNKFALNILTIFGRIIPDMKLEEPYTFFRSFCDFTEGKVSVGVYPYTKMLLENVSINVRNFIATKNQLPCKFCDLRPACDEGIYMPRLYWDGKFKTCLCKEDNTIDLFGNLGNIDINTLLRNFYPRMTRWERRK